ncbi:hypothetical protein H4R24_004696 [Coemansia sp. RSA 988]|nr:hypothetical protein H4R24_004696 [Coemansia sp. RSA 988]
MHAEESGAESGAFAADVDMEDAARAAVNATDIEMMSEVKSMDEENPEATGLHLVSKIQPAAGQVAMEDVGKVAAVCSSIAFPA